MADNCVVPKLKGVYTGDNLQYLNEVRLKNKAYESLTNMCNYFYFKKVSGKNITVKALNGGKVQIANRGFVTEDTITDFDVDSAGYTLVTLENRDYDVVLLGKFDIVSINISYVSGRETTYTLDISQLDYAPLSGATTIFGGKLEGLFSYCGNTASSITDLTFSSFLVDVEENNNSGINLDSLSDCINLANIEGWNMQKCTGSLLSLKDCLSLIGLSCGNSNIGGAVEDFANEQVIAGRTSGELRIYGRCGITYGGSTFNDRYIRYGADMVSPTAEEIARGWQVT